MQRQITFATRTQTPEDPIDVIFNQVQILNKERKLKELEPIVNLCVGQPHLGTHPHIVSKIREFLTAPESTHSFPYEDLQGSPETLGTICKLYQQYYPNVTYAPEEVMITNGATQALHNALGALIDEGDKVLVVEPYYSAYSSIIKEMRGEIVKIATVNNDFRLSAKLLTATLQKHPKAKVLLLNYPNNPSGVDLTFDELKGLTETLKNYPDIIIIVDDVYRDLSTKKHYTLLDVDPTFKDRCIMIYSASKGFALPGARIGMAGATSAIIKAMTTQQAKATSSISTLTERGLISALDFKLSKANEFNEWIASCIRTYTENRHMVSNYLESLGFDIVYGGHGLFVLASADFMINHPIPDTIEYASADGKIIQINRLHQKIGLTFKNDTDLILFFLHTTGVALIPGSAFGIDESKGFMRISCAKDSNDLQLALTRMKQALNTIPGIALNKKLKLPQMSAIGGLLFSPASSSPTPASTSSRFAF